MTCWLIALIALLDEPATKLPSFRVETVNAESNFEAAGVADIDGDGALDVICGDAWYRGPNFERHPLAQIASDGGYRLDFANVPLDVDGDRDPDVVSCNWHARSVLWRENPLGVEPPPALWTDHAVDEPGNMETALEADVDQDGHVDFLPDVAQCVVWYSIDAGKLVRHTIAADVGGHGIGIGDVNGDGRADLLKPSGWFEAPQDRRAEKWPFHAEWNLGQVGIAMLVHDFNGDGLADLFCAMGHDYGTFWLEQSKRAEEKWVRHDIDRDWSQGHALRLADLDGDGALEVVTGKRKYAHEHDPGAEDEMVVFAYSFDRATHAFTRHTLSRGGKVGLGLAPVIVDLDRDGDLDIVAPGKSGLYLLRSDRIRKP